MSGSHISELPDGWSHAPLGKIVEFTKRPRGLDTSGNVPFLPMALISEGGAEVREFETRRAPKSGTYFEEGDFLLARITPCFENGKQAIVRDVPGGFGLATTEVYPMRSPVVSAHFLALFFRWPSIHGELVRHMEGATGRMRLPIEALRDLSIPIPPRPEQDRIVDALGDRMAEIDGGVEALDQAEQALGRFHAAVLTATVTGRLTPPAGQGDSTNLISTILEERLASWERDQLAGFAEKGKVPKSDEWKKRYKPAAEPDPPNVPIPESWDWATVDQLATRVQYGTSAKTNEREDDGVPVLRMGNLNDGRLRLDSLKYLPADHPEFPGLLLQDGDVLFNRTNSPELVGKAAVFRGELEPCSFASYLIRVQLSEHYRPELLGYFLTSTLGRRWVRSVVSQQVGQANVNGTKLKHLTIPVPPLDAQAEICEVAEEQFRIIETARSGIAEARTEAKMLRDALLREAFVGRLIRQDPADEPAAELLGRVRA